MIVSCNYIPHQHEHANAYADGVFLFVIALYGFQKLSQNLELRLFQIHLGISVDIHSGADVSVSEDILYDLHIHLCLAQSCSEGMPERMTAESRK